MENLKSGVRIFGVDSVDCVWLTCCALHNWLLELMDLVSNGMVVLEI